MTNEQDVHNLVAWEKELTDITELTRLKDHLEAVNVINLDHAALVHNIEVVRSSVGKGRKLIVVVKGNCYGHGVCAVAKILEDNGVSMLATGAYREAAKVRSVGVVTPILILGQVLLETIKDIVNSGFVPTVGSLEEARVVSNVAKSSVSVFVKVDSGFGRFGIPLIDAVSTVKRLVTMPHLIVEGIYTHLPFSDRQGLLWAGKQLQHFEAIVTKLSEIGIQIPITQALSSPGIMCGLQDELSAVAPGSMIYGINPLGADLAPEFGRREIHPVLSAIRTRLTHVTRRPLGSTARPSWPKSITATGVVPIGLAHGYRTPRNGRTAVMLVRGRRAIVHRVCLENMILDLSAIDNPKVGEEVVVVGSQGESEVTMENLADWQGSTTQAVMMGLGQTFARRVIGSTM